MNNGKFTISMQGWLDDPTITRSNDGKWEAVTGYDVGPGLHYKPADGDITQTTSISFSLPETGVTKLANGQAPVGDYYFYLWNGVDFDLDGVDGSPNFTQILQPVIWKGKGAIAIPVNNESNTAGFYTGYTWITITKQGKQPSRTRGHPKTSTHTPLRIINQTLTCIISKMENGGN